MPKQRLDFALVARGLCATREKAKRAVMAGQVTLNGQPALKPGQSVRSEDRVELAEPERFVSRGGHKLEHGLQTFGLNPAGLVALDLGASTGGFTDCLLQAGAQRIYAVDVGAGLLAWKLRQDPRVVVMDKTNARDLTLSSMPLHYPGADLAVIDCSFISLKKIIPAAVALLRPTATIVALVKPQFEAGKTEADKGRGVIRDPAVHDRVLEDLRNFVGTLPGLRWCDHTPSPLLGPAGNREFLVWIEKTP